MTSTVESLYDGRVAVIELRICQPWDDRLEYTMHLAASPQNVRDTWVLEDVVEWWAYDFDTARWLRAPDG